MSIRWRREEQFELHCSAANTTEHGLRLVSSGPESAMQHRIGSHPLHIIATEHYPGTNCPLSRADSEPDSPQIIGSRLLQRTATEHSRAESRHPTTKMPGLQKSGLDAQIMLHKCRTPSVVCFKSHNTRTPDVGIGIQVFMPSPPEMTEYYGEYFGHGASKTAFELHCPGACFHGKVLKVAR